jgi:lipoprotein-anchoring transpeptidase ErfK/SrfK
VKLEKRDKQKLLISVFYLILSISSFVEATEYLLPSGDKRLIGHLEHHVVQKGDYFQEIAERYNVGFLALLAANPEVDPFLPKPGYNLLIPSQMLLPFVKREGIVINLPELRLYYFLPTENKVMVFPVGIGREGLETPRTTSYIGKKRENPVWRPTKETRARYLAKHGKEMVREVAAGPDNPFGRYALRLGLSEYLIHGSNKRFGIGMRASAGCIRMYDDDIKWLFDHVPEQTPVNIIEQPVKMSHEQPGLKLIEIHQPLTQQGVEPQKVSVPDLVKTFFDGKDKYWPLLLPYFEEPKGVVIAVKSRGENR